LKTLFAKGPPLLVWGLFLVFRALLSLLPLWAIQKYGKSFSVKKAFSVKNTEKLFSIFPLFSIFLLKTENQKTKKAFSQTAHYVRP